MKYLDKYYQWMESGKIDDNGLCNALGKRSVNKFKPKRIMKINFVDSDVTYWAYGGESKSIRKIATDFTPLRQNIVLFLAAQNGEL